MVLTEIQRKICRLIAQNRREQGEAYIAGGVALNTWLNAPRTSRDIDLFHDTREALDVTWDLDRELLRAHGYDVAIIRERSGFVEALVSRPEAGVLMQWACDSAFRFFPLVSHEELGLTLHPFDLATNKVLALVGRLETRDWVDLIACARFLQPLGYLTWAACGKDPGFNPASILAEAGRTAHYSQEEIDALAFTGPAPDAGQLSRQWRRQLEEARLVHDQLPAETAGQCVLTATGRLFKGGPVSLRKAFSSDRLRFHRGRIRGAWPEITGFRKKTGE